MERVKQLLEARLYDLSGQAITPASVLTGLCVLVVALFVARSIARATGRLLRRRGASEGVQFALAKMVKYALSVVGAAVAIEAMGFNLNAILAASAVLLVGIGFGLQNAASNLISGMILLVEQPVRKGDFVKVGDAYGNVEDIGLRATKIITRDEVTIVVPNSELVTKQVVNHSQPTRHLRVWVHVGVAFGTDSALVEKTLLGVADRCDRVLKEPAAEVRFEAFGDSRLQFSLLVWIADPREDLAIASELRFMIDRAFREAGILIPFPQHDVHLRSGFDAPRAAAPARSTTTVA